MASYAFTDADYDDGDILDALLQKTPRTTESSWPGMALSAEALSSSLPPSSPVDDNASTCSSTTVAVDDDDTSVTSMSVSGNSVASSQSSRVPAKKPAVIPVSVTGHGRRRRRRRRDVAAAVSTASDTGFGSLSVTEMGKPFCQRPSRAVAVEDKNETPTDSPTKLLSGDRPSKPAKQPKSKSKTPKNKRKGFASAATDIAHPRHPTLQIALDLDVELQLKSKVKGDICLTLVLEETGKVASRASPEIRRNADGQYTAYSEWDTGEDAGRDKSMQKNKASKKGLVADIEEIEVTRVAARGIGTQRREICHLRVGRLDITRRWWMGGYEMVSRMSPPVVVGVVVTMPVVSFVVAWAAAQWAVYWPW